MNIENELEKDGIKIIAPLDTLSITLIAKFVAEKFISSLPFYKFNYHNLFTKITRISMYIVDIPLGMSEANYFYKNSSIYFKQGLTLDEMKVLAIHEFIHHFQEIKDNNGMLYRLGLCDFSGMKNHGMAMNEAAVQLISSRILKKEKEDVKYYGIEFSTTSPTYYPLICNLISQMSYITGEDVLLDSTLYSNNNFKNSFMNLCGREAFYKVEKKLDKILNAEEKIILSTSKLENENISEKEIAQISTKIGNWKKIIQNTFIETQNIILKSYFDEALYNIYSVQDIEEYRKKLYSYKDLIGTIDGYTFFNDYYINKMTKLDEIYESITGVVSLVTYKRNIFQIIFDKLNAILGTGFKIADR